ncbi:hypothetical protein BOW53_03615 [Solemya pervernicosa gill symbiont]|uniref:histidine kinase n=2 Tax=Gammaproteobacteria incertae sedis TaxID=118884 RepID=A0A1T2L8V9_9GAMM|nr:ATP-binding protein [Candidatus Reidiella endopervernicosa]OOZ41472.1 hypothetical protein BOW53_03615 [Solemya pervernicosa gill symbiont]QKQ27333.1 response regulator [Candidatus Reidiella endopervernicosa]
MYGITEAIRHHNQIDEILSAVVEIMPMGWQHPKHTTARITIDDMVIIDESFQITPWKMSSEITIDERSRGRVEIFYTKSFPEIDEGPFLLQERNLLNSIAKTVSEAIERNEAETALADSEQRLREAQSMAHIGNWHSNMTTGDLSWSDEVFHIFGREGTTYIPSLRQYHESIHPDDLQLVESNVQLARESGSYDATHRIVRPDGSVRHVHELAQASFNASGEPVSLTGTIQDITDQIEAEQALIIARDEAEQANTAKSDFLSRMSHELRTPMNAVLGFAQLLEYESTLTEEQQSHIHEIIIAGNHLLALINEVLDLAKVESGKLDMEFEPLQLFPLIKECSALVSTLAEKRQISISINGVSDSVVVADRTRLKQALLNLLSNAIKYNSEKGNIIIEVEALADRRIRVLVTDNGTGIPADRISELFEPFTRLSADKTYIEGTGIGLTLTRKIIEAMKGSIGVSSNVGVGSTFWFDLPQGTPEQSERFTRRSKHSDEPQQTIDKGRVNVLYIEDNSANMRLVAQFISKRPQVRLLEAATPSIGLELATAHHPDLILLDINMPEMDGYQVLKRLQKSDELRHIPVIAVTADAMPHDIKRGLEAGFSDYLTKPLNIEDFFSHHRSTNHHQRDQAW